MNIFSELSITADLENGKLKIKGLSKLHPDEARKAVEYAKTHKARLLKQALLDQVTTIDTRRFLSNVEFTQRYMILMRGYRSGIITEKTKDEGLMFLLNIWRPKKSERI